MNKIILETERLILREMNKSDYADICKMLKDEQVMYAYEHAFSDEEAVQWIERQMSRYKQYGFGWWAVILKDNGKLIGQCGLTMQPCGDSEKLEVGYMFCKEYWKKGYATEAAVACKEYAFDKLKAESVCSIIRENNIPSQNVAIRNGMTVTDRVIKHYYGMDMPHLVYSVKNTKT